MGANLCSTLGRRADDLCPGLGGLPPVLRVGAEGGRLFRQRGSGISPPGKFGYFT